VNQLKTMVEGLPPSARMQKRGDFLRCQAKGKRHYSQSLQLVHLDNERGQDRLGLVVTKKTGNAVVRNRWKRVIRETFRHQRNNLKLQQDWVVMVKRSVQGLPPKELPEELIQLWKRTVR
jgi:ribonuclease P protein component